MELNQPVAELPVPDVQKAQAFYRDKSGCKIEWTYPDNEIGAVSNEGTAIFFRRQEGAFEPVVHGIYCSDVDDSYHQLQSAGASIVDDIADKPWGIRQFSGCDLNGHVFHFHGG